MKILFFGDIVGRIGRRAIVKILPRLKKDLRIDLVLANGENMAHGKGVTIKTVKEVLDAGIDYLTSGNHFWSKREDVEKVLAAKMPIIRPANYSGRVLGKGWAIIKVEGTKILLINLLGQSFIKDEPRTITNPFRRIDNILSQIKPRIKIIIVDFHAEATAEKVALGHYLDGRISALVGTHTHIPTADERVLTNGTAYITDIGMVGAKESVIGAEKELIIERLVTSQHYKPIKLEIPKHGRVLINAVLIEINKKTGLAKKIRRIKREVVI